MSGKITSLTKGTQSLNKIVINYLLEGYIYFELNKYLRYHGDKIKSTEIMESNDRAVRTQYRDSWNLGKCLILVSPSLKRRSGFYWKSSAIITSKLEKLHNPHRVQWARDVNPANGLFLSCSFGARSALVPCRTKPATID